MLVHAMPEDRERKYVELLEKLSALAPLRWRLRKDVAAMVVEQWSAWREQLFSGLDLDDALENLFADARWMHARNEEPRTDSTGARSWSGVRLAYRVPDALCAFAEAFEHL